MRREDAAAALNPANPDAAKAEAIAINERNRAKARASWKCGPWPDVPCATCGAPCAKAYGAIYYICTRCGF
jgi:hypothetical protein